VRDLLMILEDMRNAPLPAAAANVVEVLRELVIDDPAKIVATHVVPVLWTPGLDRCGGAIVPWLGDLMEQPKFRDWLLSRLVTQFPLTHQFARTIFVELIETAVANGASGSTRRLLANFATCAAGDDVNAAALVKQIITAESLDDIITAATAADLAPFLEIALGGASRKHPNKGACMSVLMHVIGLRGATVREFLDNFRDKTAVARKMWARIAAGAGVADFSTDALESDPISEQLATAAGKPVLAFMRKKIPVE
jgi:hypothetical protein